MQSELFKMKFTHRQIVESAYKWVLKNGRVGIAFKELVSSSSEIPDVIAFSSWHSIMIECKVSRSDFLCDKKKPHRTKGMGTWRFYCCPAGMIKKEELPPKWGLIYVNENGKASIEYDCRVKRIEFEPYTIGGYTHSSRLAEAEENKFEADRESEMKLLYTALRRINIKRGLDDVYHSNEK